MKPWVTATVCVLWVAVLTHAADVWHVRVGVCDDCSDLYVEAGLGPGE